MSSIPLAPPERRPLPNVPIDEQGLRQLEIWLRNSTIIRHGHDHRCGGLDPVPGLCDLEEIVDDLDPGGGNTFSDAVLAHVAIAHYWPADETGGDLVDRVGNWDLTIHIADVGGDTYPMYGPITNKGVQGIPADDEGRFTRIDSGHSMFDGSPFTILLWVYPTLYTLSEIVNVGASGTTTLIGLSWAFNKLQGSYGTVALADPDDLVEGGSYLIGLRFDGTTLELLKNSAVVDSAAAAGGTINDTVSWLNAQVGPAWYPFNGASSNMAFFTAAVDDDFLAELQDLPFEGTAPADYVPVSDGTGHFSWQSQTVEVQY